MVCWTVSVQLRVRQDVTFVKACYSSVHSDGSATGRAIQQHVQEYSLWTRPPEVLTLSLT